MYHYPEYTALRGNVQFSGRQAGRGSGCPHSASFSEMAAGRPGKTAEPHDYRRCHRPGDTDVKAGNQRCTEILNCKAKSMKAKNTDMDCRRSDCGIGENGEMILFQYDFSDLHKAIEAMEGFNRAIDGFIRRHPSWNSRRHTGIAPKRSRTRKKQRLTRLQRRLQRR